MIQYFYILQNDHHSKSSSHSSPYMITNFFSYDENFYDLLSTFQIYDTVWLIIITMRYITSLCLIYFLAGSFWFLTLFTCFCPNHLSPLPCSPLTSGNHQSVLCILVLALFGCLFRSAYKWDHAVFVFVWLIPLSIMPSVSIDVVANGSIFFFYGWTVFLYVCVCTRVFVCVCVCIIFFIPLSINGHMLFLYLDYCK